MSQSIAMIMLNLQSRKAIRRPEPAHETADRATALVVVRIPKSASKTLANLVHQAFPQARKHIVPNTVSLDGCLSPFQRVRHARHTLRHNFANHRRITTSQVFKLIDASIAPGDLITGGHIDFATCRANVRAPLKFATLVRDPAMRVLSEYNYARYGHQRKTFLAKLDAGIAARAAGTYSFEGFLSFLLERRDVYGDIACRYTGIAQDTDIANHMRTYAGFAATVEDLPRFAAALKDATGVDVSVGHLNKTPKRQSTSFSHAARRMIENLYARDFALHAACHDGNPAREVFAAE